MLGFEGVGGVLWEGGGLQTWLGGGLDSVFTMYCTFVCALALPPAPVTSCTVQPPNMWIVSYPNNPNPMGSQPHLDPNQPMGWSHKWHVSGVTIVL